MAQSVDNLQQVGRALSGFNVGNVLAFIVDATISGANTFATLYSRVQTNINAAGVATENNQAGLEIVLRSLTAGNVLGILTDTNLNGKTTVAGVRALFTAEDNSIPATYTANTLN